MKIEDWSARLEESAKVHPKIGHFIAKAGGEIVCSAGAVNEESKELVTKGSSIIFRGTRDMVGVTKNPNEAQGMSVGDKLHALIIWLGGEYFLVFDTEKPIDPSSLPRDFTELAQSLREGLPEGQRSTHFPKPWWQFWK